MHEKLAIDLLFSSSYTYRMRNIQCMKRVRVKLMNEYCIFIFKNVMLAQILNQTQYFFLPSEVMYPIFVITANLINVLLFLAN